MKIPQSPKVMAILIIASSLFSCSKDSDLFAEFVVSRAEEALVVENLVIDDSYSFSGQDQYTLDVLSNDTFLDNNQINIVNTSTPSNGSVVINDDNTLTYIPNEEVLLNKAYVLDSFDYTVQVISDDETTSSTKGNVEITLGLKAFPTAFGGGSNASGGRGRALAIVNTLDRNAPLEYFEGNNDHEEYYEGGFISALREPEVGYIVFNVSGNINLGLGGTANEFGPSGLDGVNNKTVFGQSAPRGGITLTGGTFRISGRFGDAKNLIFRYFRSRPIFNKNGVKTVDDDSYTWAFLFYGGKDIIVDHCSGSFAQDKAFGAFLDESIIRNGNTLENITFSNNISSASGTGMYCSINPNRPNDPENFVDNISFIKNVMISCNRTPNLAFNGRADVYNNVIHDTPTKQTSIYHNTKMNQIGNYYSRSDAPNRILTRPIEIENSGIPVIYTSKNYHEGILEGLATEDNMQIWVEDYSGSKKAPDAKFFTQARHQDIFNPPLELNANQSFTELITQGNAGAYKYLDNDGDVKIFRDSFDAAQLDIVTKNEHFNNKNVDYWSLPSLPINSRPSTYDSDHDGMADTWELKEFGNLDQSYNGDYDEDGYENIEEYMNQVDFD